MARMDVMVPAGVQVLVVPGVQVDKVVLVVLVETVVQTQVLAVDGLQVEHLVPWEEQVVYPLLEGLQHGLETTWVVLVVAVHPIPQHQAVVVDTLAAAVPAGVHPENTMVPVAAEAAHTTAEPTKTIHQVSTPVMDMLSSTSFKTI